MTRRTFLTTLSVPALAGAAETPTLPPMWADHPDYGYPALGGAARRLSGSSWFAGGYADLATRRLMTTQSPVRIASISKLVTAFGFMTLVEAGKVSLDDDVSDILGWTLRHPLFPRERITPRRLLSHTSGLRDGPAYPVLPPTPLAASLTVDAGWFGPAGEPPGDWFAYCNTGFVVIGQIVERLSGLGFGPFMTETVFKPLGLDCGYNWSGVGQAARDGVGILYRKAPSEEGPYDPNGPWIAQMDDAVPAATNRAAPVVGGKVLTDYAPGTNGFAFSPQGGLRVSAVDIGRLAQVLADGGAPLLKPETLALMTTPGWRLDAKRPNGDGYGGAIRAYGLACQTLTGIEGDNLFDGCDGWIGHAGDAYGLTSGLWVEPKSARTMTYFLTGESRSLKANRGRSNFTLQEEALAGSLSRP